MARKEVTRSLRRTRKEERKEKKEGKRRQNGWKAERKDRLECGGFSFSWVSYTVTFFFQLKEHYI